jgi:glycosyltransferase involved in cell wall biosynthesis
METPLLRILVVSPFAYPQVRYGGSMIASDSLLRELSRRGHEISIYSTEIRGNWKKRIPHLSMEILTHRSWIEGLFFSPSFAISMGKLDVERYDLIYVINCRNFPSTLGLLLGEFSHKPLVLAANGSLLAYRYDKNRHLARVMANRLQEPFLKRLVPKVTAALAVSEEETKHYVHYGIERSKIEVVGNGIDLGTFKPGASDFRETIHAENSFLICYVGRLDPIKGLPILIESFRLVLESRRDARLAIIGPDFGMKAKLQQHAQDLGVDSRTFFVDLMSTPELVSAYRGADVVAVPSYFEIFGMSAAESLACGTPVVCSNTGGLREIVKDGVSGFLVQPGNPEQLASKLLVFADTNNKEMYRDNALRGAKQFDLQLVGSRVERALRRLLD